MSLGSWYVDAEQIVGRERRERVWISEGYYYLETVPVTLTGLSSPG